MANPGRVAGLVVWNPQYAGSEEMQALQGLRDVSPSMWWRVAALLAGFRNDESVAAMMKVIQFADERVQTGPDGSLMNHFQDRAEGLLAHSTAVVPRTLVLVRTPFDDKARAREIAASIDGSLLTTIPGDATYPMAGDQEPVIRALEDFSNAIERPAVGLRCDRIRRFPDHNVYRP